MTRPNTRFGTNWLQEQLKSIRGGGGSPISDVSEIKIEAVVRESPFGSGYGQLHVPSDLVLERENLRTKYRGPHEVTKANRIKPFESVLNG